MPQVEGTRAQIPLALRVLRDELEELEARFQTLMQSEDGGEREARRADLLRAVDRYLRLEAEVFHPVLERSGIDHAQALASHRTLRSALDEISRRDARERGLPHALDVVHEALRTHWRVQEQSTFPRAARQLGDELPGLAIELQEVRSRMKGAYGV
jgi:hypothetical protein